MDKQRKRYLLNSFSVWIAILVLSLVLVACEAPVPTVTVDDRQIYVPIIENGARSAHTNIKKGVSLWFAPCETLERLGVTWYYTGQACPGFQQIPYLDTPASLTPAAVKQLGPGPFMFLNEPDLGQESMSDLVDLAVAALSRANVTAVGPCVAHDLDYVEAFWLMYRQATGQSDARPAAICFHCYGTAAGCIARTESAIAVADRLGVDQVWLTELGMVPGMMYSIGDILGENQILAEYLDNNPRVGRHAYWAAAIRYGATVPADPCTGWQPLVYEWYRVDGSVEWRLTPLGT